MARVGAFGLPANVAETQKKLQTTVNFKNDTSSGKSKAGWRGLPDNRTKTGDNKPGAGRMEMGLGKINDNRKTRGRSSTYGA